MLNIVLTVLILVATGFAVVALLLRWQAMHQASQAERRRQQQLRENRIAEQERRVQHSRALLDCIVELGLSSDLFDALHRNLARQLHVQSVLTGTPPAVPTFGFALSLSEVETPRLVHYLRNLEQVGTVIWREVKLNRLTPDTFLTLKAELHQAKVQVRLESLFRQCLFAEEHGHLEHVVNKGAEAIALAEGEQLPLEAIRFQRFVDAEKAAATPVAEDAVDAADAEQATGQGEPAGSDDTGKETVQPDAAEGVLQTA